MPVRAHVISNVRKDTISYIPDILPGLGAAILDKSTGCWKLPFCNLDDDGGFVALADGKKEPPASIDKIEFGPVAIILPGFKLEMNIVDYEGECGRLVLQHVLGQGIINSPN
jgi:hypothetical protein